MLSLQECLDLCDLPPATISAIAEHEHVPEIVAAEMGCSLTHSPQGICRIREFLQDNIAQAESCGLCEKAKQLGAAYQEFTQAFPLRAT